jgi:hypothetical protein
VKKVKKLKSAKRADHLCVPTHSRDVEVCRAELVLLVEVNLLRDGQLHIC